MYGVGECVCLLAASNDVLERGMLRRHETESCSWASCVALLSRRARGWGRERGCFVFVDSCSGPTISELNSGRRERWRVMSKMISRYHTYHAGMQTAPGLVVSGFTAPTRPPDVRASTQADDLSQNCFN
jgi:hypothetical protein